MAKMKFEDAMERLEQIVQNLERGDLSLEDSLTNFEEGMQLIKFSTKKLEEVEKKVNMLAQDERGQHKQVPFEPENEEDNGDSDS